MVHLLWFPSLVLSLSTAVFATLVQELVRRYLLLTNLGSAHTSMHVFELAWRKRAHLLSFNERSTPCTRLCIFPSFFSFTGLIAVTSNGGTTIVVANNVYIFVPLVLYLRYSLTPCFEPHSLHSTVHRVFAFRVSDRPHTLPFEQRV